MKKIKFFVPLLFFLCFKADNLPKAFSELLEQGGLVFSKPEGFTETKCIANRQMNYEYALRLPGGHFEVRYAIRPGKDRPSYALFQTTLLNIGLGGSESGMLPAITGFDSASVRKEFNADAGGTAFVNLGKEFGQKYKYCIAVTIHKNGVGDAYFFYLCDDKKKIGELMKVPFHSLKFK